MSQPNGVDYHPRITLEEKIEIKTQAIMLKNCGSFIHQLIKRLVAAVSIDSQPQKQFQMCKMKPNPPGIRTRP